MKLKNELQPLVERMKKLDHDNVIKYANELKKSKDYKNFEIRISNDILYACTKPDDICDWYDKYNCNDTHKTTLAIAATKSGISRNIYKLNRLTSL